MNSSMDSTTNAYSSMPPMADDNPIDGRTELQFTNPDGTPGKATIDEMIAARHAHNQAGQSLAAQQMAMAGLAGQPSDMYDLDAHLAAQQRLQIQNERDWMAAQVNNLQGLLPPMLPRKPLSEALRDYKAWSKKTAAKDSFNVERWALRKKREHWIGTKRRSLRVRLYRWFRRKQNTMHDKPAWCAIAVGLAVLCAS